MKKLLLFIFLFTPFLILAQNIVYDTLPYNYNGWMSISNENDTYIFYEKEGDLSRADYEKILFNTDVYVEFHTDTPINMIIFQAIENDTVRKYLGLRKGENLGNVLNAGQYVFMYTFKNDDLINVYDIDNYDKSLFMSFETNDVNNTYYKDYQLTKDILLEFLGNDGGYVRNFYVTKTPIQTNIDTNEKNISIYPNPVSDQLFIKTDEKIKNVEVFNVNGVLVKSFSPYLNDYVDFGDLKTGTYIINVYIKEQK